MSAQEPFAVSPVSTTEKLNAYERSYATPEDLIACLDDIERWRAPHRPVEFTVDELDAEEFPSIMQLAKERETGRLTTEQFLASLRTFPYLPARPDTNETDPRHTTDELDVLVQLGLLSDDEVQQIILVV